MLATILRTSVASKMSVAIMRAFVVIRKYISTNLIEQKYINNQVMKNTEDIKLLQASFQKFEEKTEVNTIFFLSCRRSNTSSESVAFPQVLPTEAFQTTSLGSSIPGVS